jgi:hypothetical protein
MPYAISVSPTGMGARQSEITSGRVQSADAGQETVRHTHPHLDTGVDASFDCRADQTDGFAHLIATAVADAARVIEAENPPRLSRLADSVDAKKRAGHQLTAGGRSR